MSNFCTSLVSDFCWYVKEEHSWRFSVMDAPRGCLIFAPRGANCWCLEFASPWKWPEFASSYQQLHSQPRLLVLEDRRTADTWADGWTTYKSKDVGRNWHLFGAGQRGSNAFVSIDSQKNLESEFLYWKVLFIHEIRRDNGILCFLVITRGLPEFIGFGDTWWFNSDLIWKAVAPLECSAGWCCEALTP